MYIHNTHTHTQRENDQNRNGKKIKTKNARSKQTQAAICVVYSHQGYRFLLLTKPSFIDLTQKIGNFKDKKKNQPFFTNSNTCASISDVLSRVLQE